MRLPPTRGMITAAVVGWLVAQFAPAFLGVIVGLAIFGWDLP